MSHTSSPHRSNSPAGSRDVRSPTLEGDSPIFAAEKPFLGGDVVSAARIGTVPVNGNPAGSQDVRSPTLEEAVHWRLAPADTAVLTVIVPVFNEARTIDCCLRRIRTAPYRKEIIVVDDGSTDGTSKILEPWRTQGEVTLIRHDVNRGKGAAIRSGLACARSRFTIIQDADLEYDPQDYPRLIEPLLSGASAWSMGRGTGKRKARGGTGGTRSTSACAA